jgi:hypothetical protein
MKHKFHYINQKFRNIVGLRKSHIRQYFLVVPQDPPNIPQKSSWHSPTTKIIFSFNFVILRNWWNISQKNGKISFKFIVEFFFPQLVMYWMTESIVIADFVTYYATIDSIILTYLWKLYCKFLIPTYPHI